LWRPQIRASFAVIGRQPEFRLEYNGWFAHGRAVRGARMIKSELIAKLAEENPHLTQRDIERVVSVVLERMIEALEQGGRVELRGFGALSVRSREARAGRNPRTGEPVAVRAKHVPFFKSGKELRERLNATDE